MRKRIEGPDFLGIGMPKAGTAWLFDQLNHHPDFWMPPMKGLHYFRSDTPQMRQAEKNLARAKDRGQLRGRPLDERDRQFLKDTISLGGKPRDLQAYAALFRHKGDLLSGDITAAYCDLDGETIAQIAAAMPWLKIVMMVRDPVARAWSRISMAWRKGEFEAVKLDNVVRLQRYIAKQRWLEPDHAYPTRVVRRWKAHAPELSYHFVMLDDVASRPAETRHAVLTFLGGDSAKPSGDLDADHNKKSHHEKLKVNEASMAVMVEHFKQELFDCVELFGDPARNWLRLYGLTPNEPGACKR